MARRPIASYKRSLLRLLISLAALLLLWHLPARSQDGRTALEGLVEDLSGARIAGAQVTLANPDNGFRTTVKTEGDGVFRFAMLASGRYGVTVSAQGMVEVVDRRTRQSEDVLVERAAATVASKIATV